MPSVSRSCFLLPIMTGFPKRKKGRTGGEPARFVRPYPHAEPEQKACGEKQGTGKREEGTEMCLIPVTCNLMGLGGNDDGSAFLAHVFGRDAGLVGIGVVLGNAPAGRQAAGDLVEAGRGDFRSVISPVRLIYGDQNDRARLDFRIAGKDP